MRTLNVEQIEDLVYRLARRAGVTIAEDCLSALVRAEREETGAAKFALGTVLQNAEIAQATQMPVCQDTGMTAVFLELGQDVALTGGLLQDAVNAGVRRAYADGNFRKSICDPLTRVNTGDNTPAHLHVEIVAGDGVRVRLLPKGFGSENMSAVCMLTPAEGREGVLRAIVETVKKAGSRPCPPVVVGVGIGGSFDGCTLLAKKALFRDLGSKNPREDVASIEEEALARINALGIGAQGFGGKITALKVLCEVAPTHIAGLPVAVNIQCHCVRHEEGTL